MRVVLLAGQGRHLRVPAVRRGPGAHLRHSAPRVAVMSLDSPEVAAAKRLLDLAKDRGFSFQRVAPGEDGPLLGRRETVDWQDEIYLAGFANSCSAIRRRRWSLVVPGGLPVTERASGGALHVLRLVADWPG